MSEQRDRMAENQEPETEQDDVEAHVLRKANEDGENQGGDDVEAHVLRKANEDGENEGDDDVEAHVLKK